MFQHFFRHAGHAQPGTTHPRPLALALQGGGAHGAFTWGVLDTLLEDGRWRPSAISGASAGAMNAVVTAQGLMDGGLGRDGSGTVDSIGRAHDGARAALERFWMAAADRLTLEPFEAIAGLGGGDGLPSGPSPLVQAGRHWQAWIAPWFGPGAGNPLGLAPLAQIAGEQIDFDALRQRRPVALFIAATHAASGALRLFREHEISAEALLASACLPSLSAPVLVDGEPYIDGAFAANPPLLPLVTEAAAQDLLLVLLTPQSGRPAGAEGGAGLGQQPCLELALHAAFRAEWRTLQALLPQLPARPASTRPAGFAAWARRLLDTGSSRPAAPRWHLIDSHPRLAALHADSRLQAGRRYFLALRDLGRERAREWLAEGSQIATRVPSSTTALPGSRK